MTRIGETLPHLDLMGRWGSDNKYQKMAKDFLARYPVSQYAMDHPIYQDLVQLYTDLKEGYKSVDMNQVKKVLSDRGVPTVDLNTKGDFQKLIKAILKNYTFEKMTQFLATKL